MVINTDECSIQTDTKSKQDLKQIQETSFQQDKCAHIIMSYKIQAELTRNITSWVNVLTGIPNALASPKSASLSALVRRSISKFWGFRSRCRTRWEWQYAIPRSIWYRNTCTEKPKTLNTFIFSSQKPHIRTNGKEAMYTTRNITHQGEWEYHSYQIVLTSA